MSKVFKILLISFLFLLSTESIFAGRYYDSETGRWLSVDPLAEIYPGWSPYNYCLNNPLNNIDLNGDSVEIGYVAVIPYVAYHDVLILTNEETGKSTVLEGMPASRESGVSSGSGQSSVSGSSGSRRSGSSGGSSGSSSGASSSGSFGNTGWGNLKKEVVTKSDDIGKSDKETIPTPDGMTDKQFQKELMNNYNSYDNNVKYAPIPATNRGNSNSLMGSVIRASGSSFVPGRWSPGWSNNVLQRQKKK